MKTLFFKKNKVIFAPWFVLAVMLCSAFFLSYLFISHVYADSPIIISVDSVSVPILGSADMTISLDPTLSIRQPTAVQWDFTYNTNDVASVVWKENGAATLAAGDSASCNTPSTGVFRCFVGGFNLNLIPKGVLGKMTVTLRNPTSVSTIPVQFTNLVAGDTSAQSIPIAANPGTITVTNNTTTGGGTNNNSALSATCSPSTVSTTVGTLVTWTATPVGGNATYTYVWSGSNSLTGTGQTVSSTYLNEGIQTASVTVTSNGQSVTAQCTSIDIQQPKLTGWCSVTASINTSSPASYTLQWNSNLLSTLATTTTYKWSGTDGLSGTNSGLTQTYSSPGLKQGNVTITSGAQSLNFSCSADVHVVSVTPNEFLTASCQPNVNAMTVQWNTSSSGNPGTTYAWSGTDVVSTSSPTFNQVYTTEGTKSATVLITSGSQSMTLSCQARVASTTPNSGHCFIATAVFGTSLEPEVQVLRHFRDETMMKTNIGKLAVKTYYTISPPIADVIRDNETLKAVVRAGLEPIVYGLEKVGYTQ